MNGAEQLRHLIALRWRMVRSRVSRFGFAFLAGMVPVVAVAAVVFAQHAPQTRVLNIALITPSLYLAFAALAVLAPLAAGGGNELYPPDQLVAYPVRPATSFLASLALAPLNLAWTTQVITLMGTTAFLVGNGLAGPLRALATCVAYVVGTTITGQALAWAVVGVRADRSGRIGIWVLVGLISSAVLAVVSTGRTVKVLDNSPTTSVLLIAFAGDKGDLLYWSAGTGLLLFLGLFSYTVGVRVCDWSLRRPGDGRTERASRTEIRRRQARTPLAALRRVDRASVWRSAALRRGLYVLTIVPAGVAIAARLDWLTLILIPGLVAAGAGLLFGVNAFCLDATGATWLSSLPHDPLLAFRSKALVLAEVCGGAVLVAVVASSLRTTHAPTVTEATAVLAVSLSGVATVVATCMRLSVVHPHRADLRGSREAPAPPGAMAVHSARLAISTTFLALFIAMSTVVNEWWAPALAGTAICLRALRSLIRSQRLWADPFVRSRVIATVAAG